MTISNIFVSLPHFAFAAMTGTIEQNLVCSIAHKPRKGAYALVSLGKI
jgi:hypothetical protein